MKEDLSDRLHRLTMLKEKGGLQRQLSPELLRELMADFIIKSTYHSNAIEGNTLTVYETKAVLEDGITIAGKSMREHLEVINHKEAILVAEEIVQEEIPFSERVVKYLHSIVLNKIDRDNAGMYRNRNVIISGASHTPPHAFMVPELMTDLFEWYRSSTELHPVERAAILHSKFVNIHLFTEEFVMFIAEYEEKELERYLKIIG